MTKDPIAGVVKISLSEARRLMQEKKVGKLPIVNKDNEVQALMCRGDLKKVTKFPNAYRDNNGMLMVAAAIGGAGTSQGADEDFDRAQALLNAGVDILVVDVSETGVTQYTPYMIRRLKEGAMLENTLAASDLLVGPVFTRQHAKQLLDAGCNGLIVGGKEAKGCEASLIYEIGKMARIDYGAPVIADIGATTATQVTGLCKRSFLIEPTSNFCSAADASPPLVGAACSQPGTAKG